MRLKETKHVYQSVKNIISVLAARKRGCFVSGIRG